MATAVKEHRWLPALSDMLPVMFIILYCSISGVDVCEGQTDCDRGGLRGVAVKADGWIGKAPGKIHLVDRNGVTRDFIKSTVNNIFYWRYLSFKNEKTFWNNNWELTIDEYGYEKQTVSGEADRIRDGGPCWAVYEFDLKPTISNIELDAKGGFSFCYTKKWKYDTKESGDSCEERIPQRDNRRKWRRIENIEEEEAARIMVFNGNGSGFLIKKVIDMPDQNQTMTCDEDVIIRSIFEDRIKIAKGEKVERPSCIDCEDEESEQKVDPYSEFFEIFNDIDIGMGSIIVNKRNERRMEEFEKKLEEKTPSILTNIRQALKIKQLSIKQTLGPDTGAMK